MKENKTTYELQIGGDIENLKKALDEAKKALNGLGDSNFASGIDKKMASVLGQLDRLKKKASRPLSSKAAFSSLENGFSDIVEDAKGLLEELSKISKLTTKEKLSLLPEGEAKKYKDALAAVTAYDRAVEKAERNRIRQQEKRKVDQTKTSADLEKAKTDRDSAKKAHANAIAKGSKYGDAKAIVEQAEAAQKAQKEIDSLEKQLKKYQKRLEELNSVEADKRTPEWESEIATVRSNVKSIGGKIGARKKVVNKAPDEKTLAAAQKTIVTEQPNIDALEQTARDAEKEVTRLETSLAKLNDAIKNNSSEIKNSQADYKVLYAEAKKLGISLEGVTEDVSSENVRILQERMREFAERGVRPLDDALEQLTPELEKAEEAARSAGEGVKQGLESFSDKAENDARIGNLKDNIKQFIGWAGASKVLSAALRNAFQDIKELDAAMTEIAVVTDFDIGDMWDQIPTYTTRANELGLEIVEVYEASALFYQQGLDTNEMVALSTETLKMAKIAGLDAAEATDRMTAALRGFNMELDEASAQKVADVYSELAAITASDVDEISSAMTKTASIASSAGMEFETTAAFLSQIIETTRESAETAGTAMKTVIARFQELKKSPDEIGEIDGEIVDANRIEGALRSVGVSLRDAGGQFRELDDVFLELSSKWDGLDKNTQRYIATIAAGSRQQSRFIAMMQDYERTQELVTAANNSAGASQRQYEKTLESIDTKLKKLNNAWTEFSTGLMNSEVVKFAVDFLTSLLNALNKVTQGFEGFTGSLSKIGTMIAVFQTAKVVLNKFWDNIVLEVIKSAKKAMEGLNAEVKAGAQKTKSEVEAITNGEPTTTDDGQQPQEKTLKEKGKEALGITAIAEGRKQMTDANQNLETARSNLQTAKNAESYSNAVGPLEKEQIKIKKEKIAIKKQMRGDKDTYRAAEAQKALNNLEAREAEIIKDKKKISDEYAGKKVKSQMTIEEAEKNLQKAQQDSITASKEALNTMAQGAQKAGQAIAVVGVGLGVVAQMFEQAGNEEAAKFFQDVGNVFTFVGSAVMGVASLIPAFTTLFGGLVAKLVAGGISVQAAWWWVVLIVAAVVALVIGIVAIVNAIKNASPEAKLEKAKEAADNAAEAADNATEAYENLADAFERLEDGYKSLEDLTRGTEEWNKAVKNINQSVLDLIQQYPELAKFVDNEGGVLTIDLDDAGVQQVLRDAENRMIVAQNSATMANLNVARAEDNLERSKMKQSERIGHYETYGDTTVWVEEKQNTETLAKALAEGTVIDTEEGYEITDADAAQRMGIDDAKLKKWYAQTEGAQEGASDALRDFGESLLETQAQEEAAFSAIATSAMQLADTLTMTDEELSQAGNVVDDATSKVYYDEMMEKLGSTDFTSDGDSGSMTEEQKNMRDEAIKAQYGEDARIEGNTVTFRKDGEQETETLTSDEIKAIIANNYATNKTADAIEIAPQTVDQVIKNLGYAEGSAGASAIEAATQDQEGGNLTQAQMTELLGMDTEKLKEAYNALSDEQKKVFGTEQDFLDKTQGTAKIAKEAFDRAYTSAEKTGAKVQDFMTADMAEGFTSKMEEVWDVAGEEGVKQIQEAFNTLLNGQDDETKQKITARMNALDWSNAEQLLAFEIELEEQYGYSREQAQAMTSAMKEGARAVSGLTTTIDVFGDLYHATQRLNAALEKTADLQWKYDRMIKDGANAVEIATNLEEQRQSILKAGQEAINGYEAAQENMIALRRKGTELLGGGKDISKYVKYDTNTGTFDLTELQRQMEGDQFNAEEKEKIEDYIGELEEANETAKDQLDAQKDAYDQLEELNQQAEDAYWSLYEQIGDLIVSEIEKEISLQSDLLDATQDANSKLIGKLQEQIDADRQARENEKAEENISDLQNQAAYLSMDSSGANALALLDLEKQIQEEEEAYQDSLIDQSIQNLQDANDKAAEQRERQIAIQEQQLELYKTSEEYQSAISAQLDEFMAQIASGVDVEDTIVGQRLTDSGFFDDMHPGKEQDFWAGLTQEGGLAQYFVSTANNTAGTGELTQAELLEAIKDNTAAKEYYDMKTQQDVAIAEGRADNVADVLGFTIKNTAEKDPENGGYKSGSATNSFVSEVSNISTKFASGTSAATDLQDGRNKAKAQQETLSKYGLSSGIGTESQYYDDLQKDDALAAQLRGDLASTGTSNLLWSNVVASDYSSKVNNWKDTNFRKEVGEIAETGHRDGFEGLVENASTNGLANLRQKYQELMNVPQQDAFKAVVNMLQTEMENWTYGSIDGDGDDGFKDRKPGNWNRYDKKGVTTTGDTIFELDGQPYTTSWRFKDEGVKGNGSFGDQPTDADFLDDEKEDKWVVLSDNKLWAWHAKLGRWARLDHDPDKLLEAYKQKLKSGRSGYTPPAFETGGLADFTGPAWLDGTPSRPEYILNAAQTERFFSLIDVLEHYDTNAKSSSAGDNYFDIEINVEKIEDDYDVEQIAHKIRSMIYEDATYRNVNAINHIR